MEAATATSGRPLSAAKDITNGSTAIAFMAAREKVTQPDRLTRFAARMAHLYYGAAHQTAQAERVLATTPRRLVPT